MRTMILSVAVLCLAGCLAKKGTALPAKTQQVFTQQDLERMVGYEVTIDRQGNIVSLKMDPCGNDKYDAAAEKAVRDAAPYPPPPDLGADTYVIQRKIIFRKGNMHLK